MRIPFELVEPTISANTLTPWNTTSSDSSDSIFNKSGNKFVAYGDIFKK